MRAYTWARLLCEKAIDDMIAQLLKKKTDEIKHKDFCTDDLNVKQVETERGVQWRPRRTAMKSDALQYRFSMLRDRMIAAASERCSTVSRRLCPYDGRRASREPQVTNGDAQTPESKRLLNK